MKKQNSTKKALICSVLALVLCCSMLVGTTFAWFTDSVTSKGNIIQTGRLEVEMYWANADVDVSKAEWFNAAEGAMFKETTLWEPGYVEAKHIKIDNVGTLALNYQLRIVANGVVSKLVDVIDVYVVGTEKDSDGNMIDATAAITRDALGTKIGTLADVLNTTKYDENDVLVSQNLSDVITGSLLAGETDTWSLVLKMQETAGNEYQNLSVGTDFSVELIATQMSHEKDSFGPDYDSAVVVPSPEIPAALVRPLDNLYITVGKDTEYGDIEGKLLLNAGYQFQPTETLDAAKQSEYRHWHADFVVSADRKVPQNSIALAGYYSLFCDSVNKGNWVALSNVDEDIDAGTEVRLVQAMGNGAINVTYQDLCQYGNDGKGFQCGVAALDKEALAGTTITVELRMYETEGDWTDSSHNSTETGKYETIGTFKYTFPKTVSTNEDLAAAVAEGGTITVTEGTYKFPAANTFKKGTTLICEEGTEFEGKTSLNINGATVVGATFTSENSYLVNQQTVNGTFKDCTFTNSDGLRSCYAGETVVFENCVFDTDFYGVHFDSGANDVVFKNCTFTGFNTFGAGLTKLTLENCTFKYNGHGGYNGINLWGNSELTNCTFVFDGSASYEWVDLCYDNKTVTFTGCVVSDGTTERALTASDVGDYGTGNTIIIK